MISGRVSLPLYYSFVSFLTNQYLLSYQSVVSNNDLNIFTNSQVFQRFYGRHHLWNCQRWNDNTRIGINQNHGTQ